MKSPNQSAGSSRAQSPKPRCTPQFNGPFAYIFQTVFNGLETFLETLRKYRTKKVLSICSVLLFFLSVWIIGNLPRFCDKNCKKDCVSCPENAVCARYTFTCANGTFKGYQKCHETKEEALKDQADIKVLLNIVLSLSLWTVILLFYFAL